MKKRVMRTLCGILVMQLALSNGVMLVNAGEVTEQPVAEDTQDPGQEPGTDSAAESEEEKEALSEELLAAADGNEKDSTEALAEYAQKDGGDDTSTLKVQIKPPFELAKEQEIRVYLKDTDQSAAIQIDPEEKAYQTAEFPGLEPGDYVLRMEAAGYAAYEQKIEIAKGYNYSVSVAMDDSGRPGMGYMPYGDWNGDGVVEKSDVQAVVDALEDGSSALDEGNGTGALGVADNDFASYYQINDWDDAVAYHTGDEGWGLTVQLDQSFKMDRFAIAAPDDSTYYSDASVYYWEEGVRKKAQGMSLQRKTDGNGRAYYEINLASPIETDKLRFGFQVDYYGAHRIQVAEIRLYEYDSLADDIRALYTDDLYVALKENVQEAEFDRLQERIDTQINGDYHPQRTALQAELDAARKLYEEQGELDDIQKISTSISASYDSALKLSGLNAWQPLGVTAKAGEELVIYVGTDNGTRGKKSKLQLVVTQQHSEYDKLSRNIDLNIGRNVITLPELVSTDVEKGGALYIQYTGNNANEEYVVRVNGGRKIPVLNLYGVTDEAQRAEKISAYIEELSEYCANLEEAHEEDHGKKILFFSLDSYEEKTCIDNATDIMLDHMMISAPATQILAGLGSGGQTSR